VYDGWTCKECGLVQNSGAGAACLGCGADEPDDSVILPTFGLELDFPPPRPTSIRPSTPAASVDRSPSLRPSRPARAESAPRPGSAWASSPGWLRGLVLAGIGAIALAAVGSMTYRAIRRYLAVESTQAETEHTWMSRDSVVTLVTPPSFVDVTGSERQEAEADLVVADEATESRILVFDIQKRAIGRVVTLSQVALAWRRGTRAMKDVRLGRSVDRHLGVRAAVEMSFEANDSEGRPVRGIVELVDGDGYYHVIAAGCASDMFPRRESMLRSILASARFHLP